MLGGAGVPARQVKLEWLDGETTGWSSDGWGVASFTADEADMPVVFGIQSAYPNPFNSQMRIVYGLPEAARVDLAVYDLSGRRVADLINGSQSAGMHTVIFDGSGLPSGVYMVRLEAAGQNSQWKVALVK